MTLGATIALVLVGCAASPASLRPTPNEPSPPTSASASATSALAAAALRSTDPTAAPESMLDTHGCSLALIETIAFDFDALTYREGFLHDELLEGYDVLCSGTQPSTTLPTVERSSFAIIARGSDVLETIDGRILATGLEPDPIVWGIYLDAAADPVAFLHDGADWQRINETSFVDAEDYALLLWFEKP